MNVGQIVYINKEQTTISHVTTGVLVRREWDEESEMYWFDVLGDDNKIHALPAYLLSPAPFTPFTWTKEMHEKRANSMHTCINHTHNKLHYIHNDKQTT